MTYFTIVSSQSRSHSLGDTLLCCSNALSIAKRNRLKISHVVGSIREHYMPVHSLQEEQKTVVELKLRTERVNALSGRLSKDLISNLENWTKTQANEMAMLVSQIKFTIDLVEQD